MQLPRARRLKDALLPAAILLVAALPARAQEPAIYVAGAALADFKQFDSVESAVQLPAGMVDGFSQNATAAGGGIRIGTFLHPRWSLELGIDAESRTTTRLEYNILGLPRLSIALPEPTNSTRFLTVNTTVGFHPRKFGRVRLGYRGGVSFVRGTYGSSLSMPSFDAAFLRGDIGGVSISGGLSLLPQSISTNLERTDNAVGGLLGMDAAIDLTNRLAAVPALRVIAFSNNNRGVFLIRPEIGVRWAF